MPLDNVASFPHHARLMSTVPLTAKDLPAASRWGLRGDVTWRLLRTAVRGVPWYAEGLLNYFWAGLIGLGAREPRRELARNLRALGVPWAGYRAWRAFHQIGAVSVDSIHAQDDPQCLQWHVLGREHLEAAQQTGRPVVLWTAHMGSYDAAAAFFAHRIGARLHAVRKPERNAEMQRIREQDLRSRESPHYVTLYNANAEESLGLELLRVLKEGHWVALQADRALPGLASFSLTDNGETWSLPRGPFFLPMAAGAVCLPVFVRRTGPRQYGVQFYPLITPPATRDRAAALHSLATAWLPLLRDTVRAAPDQWFVFENVVTNPTSATTAHPAS